MSVLALQVEISAFTIILLRYLYFIIYITTTVHCKKNKIWKLAINDIFVKLLSIYYQLASLVNYFYFSLYRRKKMYTMNTIYCARRTNSIIISLRIYPTLAVVGITTIIIIIIITIFICRRHVIGGSKGTHRLAQSACVLTRVRISFYYVFIHILHAQSRRRTYHSTVN